MLQVHDLGLVANMGNLMTFLPVLRRVKARKALDLLVLGGSITAGGYYVEFVRQLESLDGLSVSVYNHGHGATEITYSLFCVDIDKYDHIDLVLVDFSVNDYGHPKLMDALIRWGKEDCDDDDDNDDSDHSIVARCSSSLLPFPPMLTIVITYLTGLSSLDWTGLDWQEAACDPVPSSDCPRGPVDGWQGPVRPAPLPAPQLLLPDPADQRVSCCHRVLRQGSHAQSHL